MSKLPFMLVDNTNMGQGIIIMWSAQLAWTLIAYKSKQES